MFSNSVINNWVLPHMILSCSTLIDCLWITGSIKPNNVVRKTLNSKLNTSVKENNQIWRVVATCFIFSWAEFPQRRKIKPDLCCANARIAASVKSSQPFLAWEFAWPSRTVNPFVETDKLDHYRRIFKNASLQLYSKKHRISLIIIYWKQCINL